MTWSRSCPTPIALDGHLLPNAQQMLLLTAALESNRRGIDAFRAWRDSVNLNDEFGWDALRLMPLVYSNLSAVGVTDPLMGRLKGVYRRAWYQTHTLFRRTGPAVAALAAAGMDVLLFKGAPLALGYYRNHALRPMTDVDVCVRPSSATRAVEILRDHGWRPRCEMTSDLLRYRHALQFVHSDGGEMDLHWHALPEAISAQHDDMFWHDVEPMEFGETTVQQLRPTSLLLQQIVHGIRWNAETPIRWIPDSLYIARTRSSEIDWDRLVAMARALRVTSRLSIGLSFLTERFALELPTHLLGVTQRLRPTLVERLENRVVLRNEQALGIGALPELVRGISEYARVVDPAQRPIAFLFEYPQFLRYKWELQGRRGILPFVFRGLLRRIRRRVALGRAPYSDATVAHALPRR